MPWGRQSGYHNLRNQRSDEEESEGFLAWARRQLDALLRSSGGPASETILYTHAMDDELTGRIPARPDRPGSFAAGNFVEDSSR